MFPALTEFVQWQGSGGVVNLRNSSIFKIHGRQLLTLHYIGIAPNLAKRTCTRAVEPRSAGIHLDDGSSFMSQETASKKQFLSSRCWAAFWKWIICFLRWVFCSYYPLRNTFLLDCNTPSIPCRNASSNSLLPVILGGGTAIWLHRYRPKVSNEWLPCPCKCHWDLCRPDRQTRHRLNNS